MDQIYVNVNGTERVASIEWNQNDIDEQISYLKRIKLSWRLLYTNKLPQDSMLTWGLLFVVYIEVYRFCQKNELMGERHEVSEKFNKFMSDGGV